MKFFKQVICGSVLAALAFGAGAAALSHSVVSKREITHAEVVATEPSWEFSLETTKIKGYTGNSFETMTGYDGNQTTAYVFTAGGDCSASPEVRFVAPGTQTTTKPYTLVPYSTAVTNVHFWYKLNNTSEKNVADVDAPYLLQVLGDDGKYPLIPFQPVNDGEWHPYNMVIPTNYVGNDVTDYTTHVAGIIVKAGDINGSLVLADFDINGAYKDLSNIINFTSSNFSYDFIGDNFVDFAFTEDIFSASAYINDHYNEFVDRNSAVINLREGILINGKSLQCWINLDANASMSSLARKEGVHVEPISYGYSFNPVSVEINDTGIYFKMNLEYFPMLDTEITFKSGLFRGDNNGIKYDLYKDLIFKSTLTDGQAHHNRIIYKTLENLNEVETEFSFNVDRWSTLEPKAMWFLIMTNVPRPNAVVNQAWPHDNYRYIFDDLLVNGKPLTYYNDWARGNYKDFDEEWVRRDEYYTEAPNALRNYNTAIQPTIVTDQPNYFFFVRIPYQLMIDLGMSRTPTFSIREGALWLSQDGDNLVLKRNSKQYNANTETQFTFDDLSVQETANHTGVIHLHSETNIGEIGYNLSDKVYYDYCLDYVKLNNTTIRELNANCPVAISYEEYNIDFFNAYGVTDGAANPSRLTVPIIMHTTGNHLDIIVHPKYWAVLKAANVTVNISTGLAVASDAYNAFVLTADYEGDTDTYFLNDLVNNGLHLNDYVENLGYCKDSEHNYYALSKAKYLALTATAKDLFNTSDVYAAARERLVEWARINGETFNISTGDFTVNANISIFGDNANNNALVISLVAIFISVIASLAIFMVIRRRHYNK